ncbi:MAG: filamentous hemagglutinin N-terminal domain-containing protein [Microcystaceae cyanobacterium]
MFHWLTYRSLLVFSCSLFSSPVLAQITSDGSLSIPTVVNTDNNLDFTIINGTQVGSNLYHSFQELSIPTGGSATFQNTGSIVNIFSRVTGQNISNIDGLIETYSNASLFLLNPNGIIFGNNARLNIGGSFIATTAESIIFQDGKIFSSLNHQSSLLLSINQPIGLQFGQQAQPIQVQTLVDQLVLKPQNTLALLGGDITIIGSSFSSVFSRHLAAPAGRLELGSVESGSFVTLNPTATGWQLSYEQVGQFREISISDLAILSTSDLGVIEGEPEQGGGSIELTGKNITLSNGAELFNFTLGEQAAGDITVNASDRFTLKGFQAGLSSGIFTITAGNGDAGNIKVNTRSLIIEDGAGITSQAFPDIFDSDFSLVGNSGNITINAIESIEIRGSNLEVGSSGIGVETRIAGNAGSIDITTKRLTILDGADIAASTFPSTDARTEGLVNEGQGGEINITATESINIQGTGQLLERTVIVDNDGNVIDEIEVITTISSRIIAETQGAGDGGSINLTTGQLILDNQGQVTASSLGEIRADNPQNLELGNAGTINIEANTISLNNQGLIRAESNSGEGGNINLKASDFIILRNDEFNFPDENPYISTRAGLDDLSGGDGGNITINTPFLAAVSTENTDIVANAFTGDGGNIDITASGIFGLEVRDNLTSLSDINVSSEFGSSGIISISRPDIDPQDSFVKLPVDIVDPQTLVVQQCGVTGEYAKGEFIITGKSGLPLNPLESVDTIQGIVDLRTPEISQSQHNFPESVTLSPIPKPIIEAQGWIKDEQGNIVLVASQGTNSQLSDLPCTILQNQLRR